MMSNQFLNVMDAETGSSNTSIDDKTDDFCENPTRDSIAEGLMSLLKPTIDQLDERVRTTRVSQLELKQQLDILSEELKKISADQSCPIDLEVYSNKLINSRHKISVVNNILQAAQDRLQKLHTQLTKETAKRKSKVESQPSRQSPSEEPNKDGTGKVMIETPLWDLSDWPDRVYEPSEDSFFLLDTLEEELNYIRSLHPINILEIGTGSGIIISAMAQTFKNSNCIAIDINPFACLATQKTASLNGVIINVVQSDLISGLRLTEGIDVLIFNPPYVPSSSEDEKDVLDKAWAGSTRGRATTDRLFPQLGELMSRSCVGYVVALEENEPLEMCTILQSVGFHASVAKKRKILGERLSVIKFTRKKTRKPHQNAVI